MADLIPSKRPRLLVFRAKKRGPQGPLDKKGEARRNWRKARVAQGLCADCANTLDRCRAAHAQQCRDTLQRLKSQVYRAYGNKCQCCGEMNEDFFTLDHVNGDGARHRIEICGKNSANPLLMYRWIIRNGYPSTIRLYCYNCNIGAYRNSGICPHREAEEKIG